MSWKQPFSRYNINKQRHFTRQRLLQVGQDSLIKHDRSDQLIDRVICSGETGVVSPAETLRWSAEGLRGLSVLKGNRRCTYPPSWVSSWSTTAFAQNFPEQQLEVGGSKPWKHVWVTSGSRNPRVEVWVHLWGHQTCLHGDSSVVLVCFLCMTLSQSEDSPGWRQHLPPFIWFPCTTSLN